MEGRQCYLAKKEMRTAFSQINTDGIHNLFKSNLFQWNENISIGSNNNIFNNNIEQFKLFTYLCQFFKIS